MPDALEEQIIDDEEEDTPEELYLRSERYDNIFYHRDNDLVLEHLKHGDFEEPSLVNIHTQARDFTIFPGFDKLLSLQMAKGLISYEYQTFAAKKVLNTFRGRAMLCDEVGLGKTIEAGIILLEYILRGLARKVLILTPYPTGVYTERTGAKGAYTDSAVPYYSVEGGDGIEVRPGFHPAR